MGFLDSIFKRKENYSPPDSHFVERNSLVEYKYQFEALFNTIFEKKKLMGSNGYISKDGIIAIFSEVPKELDFEKYEEKTLSSFKIKNNKLMIDADVGFNQEIVSKIDKAIRIRNVYVKLRGSTILILHAKDIYCIIAPIIEVK